MAEQIIIEFVGDPSQLIPSIEILEKLGQIDAQTAAVFKQTNAELNKRTEASKKVVAEETKQIKTLQDVSKAAETMAEAVSAAYTDTVADAYATAGVAAQDFAAKVEGAGTSLDDITQKIAEFSTQGVDGTQKIADMIDLLEQRQESLRAASERSLDPTLLAQYESGLASTDAQLKELYTAMDKMQAEGHVLDPFNKGTEQATTKTKSLRSQLAAIREEMARVDLAVGKNNAQYKALEQQAGELKDAMGDANEQIARSGSDTKGLDNVIQLASGAAGGFAAAQGAAALFGSENGFVQESLLKVNAAMAILQGLQQVGDVMSKRQFSSIGALIGIRQADAAATVEQTTAAATNTAAQETGAAAALVNAEATGLQAEASEGAALAQTVQKEATIEQTVVTEGATVAQKLLNFVMKQNPVMWLIGGIAALVAIFEVFSNRVTKSSAAHKAFNDAQSRAAESSATEEAALMSLLAVAQDDNVSRERRKASFDEIRQKYPEYLSNLNAENVGTKAVSEAIDRQIGLIKKRAFAQAAADVYKDALKAQIEAQNEMNKTLNEGAGVWDTIKALALNGGNAMAAQQSVVNGKINDFIDATTNAEGSFGIMIQGQRDLAEGTSGTKEALQKEIEEVDKLAQSAVGVQKIMLEYKSQALKDKQATAPSIDVTAYENAKKNAMAQAQAQVDAARNGSIAELQARQNLAKVEHDQAMKDTRLSNDDRRGLEAKYQNDLEGLNIEFRERNYKDAVAHYEALAIIEQAHGRDGSEGYYQARRAGLRKAAEQAKAQEGVTAGEILKINAQLQLDLANLDVEKHGRKLQADKDVIDASIAKVKEGSKEELALKLESATADRDIQLNQVNLTAAAREKIEAEYLKKVRDLNKAYNYQVQQDALSAKQADISARLSQMELAGAADTNTQVVQLKKDAIDVAAQIEESGARNSIQNEELLQAKLKEIWAKAAVDKGELERQAQFKIIDQNRGLSNAGVDNDIKDKQAKLAKLGLFEFGARKKTLDEIRQLELSKIEGELADNAKKREKDLANKAVYDQKELELEGQKKDLLLQKEQEHQQRKQEVISQGLQLVQQVTDGIFEQQKANRQAALDQEISLLESQKAKELDNKNLTEQQKRDIEDKYKKKEAAAKLKAWKADQDAAVKQALINGALAFVKALPNFILGGAALLAAGVQVAFIKGQKPPQFARGTRYAPQGYAWVGEEGPELVELSGGEKIWSHRHSSRVAAAWEEGRPGSPDDVLIGSLPVAVDPDIISSTYITAGGRMEIDYDQLGRAISKYIPEPVQNNLSIDKDGLDHYVQKAGSKTHIRNRRYKMLD